MSRQSNQASARAVNSSRDECRRREGGSTSESAPSQSVMYASAQSSSQNGQAPQSPGHQYHQAGYETARAWEYTNPEAYRVVNNPHLGVTHQTAAPTQTRAYAYPSYNTAVPYAGQYYHPVNTYNSGSYHISSGGLTEDQIQNLNDREQPVENIDVWQNENQRDGSWYGRVER